MRYQSFSVFGPWEANPWTKFTKRGDDLLDSEIYHPAKFHRSTPTHDRDITYKIPADTHTKTDKQTSTPVNPTGVYPHMPIAVTVPFVTLTFNLSRSSKESPWPVSTMSVTYNIVSVAILDIFHVKNMTSIFDYCMATVRKVLPGSNFVSVTVFEIFRVKWLWPWPLTPQGHVKSMGRVYNVRWVPHLNCCRSSHISCQKLWGSFVAWRSYKVKCDGANRKPVGPTCKCFP